MSAAFLTLTAVVSDKWHVISYSFESILGVLPTVDHLNFDIYGSVRCEETAHQQGTRSRRFSSGIIKRQLVLRLRPKHASPRWYVHACKHTCSPLRYRQAHPARQSNFQISFFCCILANACFHSIIGNVCKNAKPRADLVYPFVLMRRSPCSVQTTIWYIIY